MVLSFASVSIAQAIPEEARRHMMRGVAAIEIAKSPADFILAAQEFEKAAKLAPNYPNIYYNLGNVQVKLGDYSSAIKSYQRYLELAPKSPDASKIKDEIYKLEFRRDQQNLTANLTGTWTTPNKDKTFKLVIEGPRFQLKGENVGDDFLTIKSLGSTHSGAMTDVPLIFIGILSENRISGQYVVPAGRYSGYCDLPERTGSFEGTIDISAGRMRITCNRTLLEYEMKFQSMFSDVLTCSRTGQKNLTGYELDLVRQP